MGLALVHYQMGDTELAYANIENAIEINPVNRTAVHVYSNWSFRDGKYYQAIEVLQKYLSASENPDEELSLVMVQLLSQINRFDLAYLEAERVLLWNPQNEKMVEIEKQLRMLAGKK